VPERTRMFNLAQLNASVAEPLTRTDRVRALKAYLGRDRRRWRVWAVPVMKMTIARRHNWP